MTDEQKQWDKNTVTLMCQDLRRAVKAKDWAAVLAVATVGEAMTRGYQQAQQQHARAGARRPPGRA